MASVPSRRPLRQSLPSVKDGRVLRIRDYSEYRTVFDETDARISIRMHESATIHTGEEIRAGTMIRVIRDTELDVEGGDDQPLPGGQKYRVKEVLMDRWVKITIQRDEALHTGWVPIEDVERVHKKNPISPRVSSALSERDSWEPVFVPASVLIQKAKVFDDGLMATVQLAAQEGAGTLVGKKSWLKEMTELVGATPGSVANLLWAARQLGDAHASIPLEFQSGVSALIDGFLEEPFRSKPMGIYSSSAALRALFHQDRILQSQVRSDDLSRFAGILQSDIPACSACEKYLGLIARLTNPPADPDLRSVLAGERLTRPDVPFFSPSQGPETNLVKRMFGQNPIPDGFDLQAVLVSQIRTGHLSLHPREDSGWYDRQLWSLEPLIRHRDTREALKWEGDREYELHLESIFKGAWALIRETHIKDLDGRFDTCARRPDPTIKVSLYPQLTTEPLATAYHRRAESYRYLLSTLKEVFGESALADMRRQTLDGMVEIPLGQEVQQMIQLFEGAAVTVERELGMAIPEADESERTESAQYFLDWADSMHQDPDLAIDCRSIVPVYYDMERRKTKAWAFLGWTTRTMTCSYTEEPKVMVYQTDGQPVPEARVRLTANEIKRKVVTPVVYETYVTDLLDRDEFRKLCDHHCYPQEIMKHLK